MPAILQHTFECYVQKLIVVYANFCSKIKMMNFHLILPVSYYFKGVHVNKGFNS